MKKRENTPYYSKEINLVKKGNVIKIINKLIYPPKENKKNLLLI